MYEIVALLSIEPGIGGHVDVAFVVGAELSEDKVLTVVEEVL